MEISECEAQTIVYMADISYSEGQLPPGGVELVRRIFEEYPVLKEDETIGIVYIYQA